MKNKLIPFASAFVLFLFFSCAKKVKCPAFSYPAFNEWLPYKTGDVVNFSNGSRNAVLKIYKSQPIGKKRDSKDGGFGGKPCERTYQIEGELKIDGLPKPDTITYNARLIGLNNAANLDGELSSFNSWVVYFVNVTSAHGFQSEALSQSEMDNFYYLTGVEPRTFGAASFDAVQAIIYKIASSSYDAIYLARGKGIAAFTLKGETSSFVVK